MNSLCLRASVPPPTYLFRGWQRFRMMVPVMVLQSWTQALHGLALPMGGLCGGQFVTTGNRRPPQHERAEHERAATIPHARKSSWDCTCTQMHVPLVYALLYF